MAVRPSPSSILLTTLLRPSVSVRTPFICEPCRRQIHGVHPSKSQVPAPTPFVPDVPTFLTLIGRSLSKHASKINTWDELFTLTSPQLKERGIEPPRARRYLLRWREKFRQGEYGIGGDLQYVTDGVADLRVVEVPKLITPGAETRTTATPASTGRTPGMNKLIVNVPIGATTYVLEEGQTTADLKKPVGFGLKNGHVITGKLTYPVKGSSGNVARIKVVEGLWEHKRGRKIFGGERRRAETLHKMRMAENKKNAR